LLVDSVAGKKGRLTLFSVGAAATFESGRTTGNLQFFVTPGPVFTSDQRRTVYAD
jgi:hypothetical protein